MEIPVFFQWSAFAVFTFIAVAGALGMTTTMSMFRSGLFLMGSFIGVAGLFILLLADLLSLLQVMMYIGGMLVMILFMVLFSMDPGGAMMTANMELKGPEALFSLGLVRDAGDGEAGDAEADGGGHGGHEGHDGGGHGGHEGHDDGGHGGHEGHGGGHGGMDMSMFTPAKKVALVLASVTFGLLATLLVLRPAWPLADTLPDPDSARRIGELLMGPYMIAFEGAGLMILLGIFGSVLVARPGAFPDPADREHLEAGVAEDPAPLGDPPLEPLAAPPPHLDEAEDAS